MKKIYLSIFTALAGLSLNAQTLTQANHAPTNGDVFSTFQCDSTGINAGASGVGATWNFASIVTHSSVVKNYSAITNANTSYPLSGVKVSSSPTNESYYTSGTASLNYWGGNITVSTTAASLIYSTPAVVAAYPMSINTTSSSTTAGSITVLSLPGTFSGNSNTLADGTGTLVLASGTYSNVIRVVTTQTINFNLPPFATGTVTQKSWDYYNVSSPKEALFTISTSTIASSVSPTSTQTIVTRRNPAVATGITVNNVSITDVMVYPNPSNTNVNFATENTNAKAVLVYDVTGKLVEKQNLNEGKLKLNVSDYTNGLYIYSVIGSNNQALKTGKITVSH